MVRSPPPQPEQAKAPKHSPAGKGDRRYEARLPGRQSREAEGHQGESESGEEQAGDREDDGAGPAVLAQDPLLGVDRRRRRLQMRPHGRVMLFHRPAKIRRGRQAQTGGVGEIGGELA